MQQRKSTLGRPSGTDGSDYSYRMVIDSSQFHSSKPFPYSLIQFGSIHYSSVAFNHAHLF
jgi:hypothetical protein